MFQSILFKGRNSTYSQVSADEDGFTHKSEDALLGESRLPTPRRRYTTMASFILIGLSALAAAFLIAQRASSTDAPKTNWVSCGNTTEEAIARNCHFDPMLISWVPDACYFPDPGDEYKPGEFSWYADDARTEPLSTAQIHAGNYTVAFTDGTHHDQHCIYTWRKLSIAIEKRLPLLDSKTMDFHHSTHCAMMVRGVLQESLAGKLPYERTYSSVPRLFAGCVPLF